MIKVTVLVAVYNASCYLPACLDSLARQTLRDIQVVCVDDASTDDSLTLLQSYAAVDDRFAVAHENVRQCRVCLVTVAAQKRFQNGVATLHRSTP